MDGLSVTELVPDQLSTSPSGMELAVLPSWRRPRQPVASAEWTPRRGRSPLPSLLPSSLASEHPPPPIGRPPDSVAQAHSGSDFLQRAPAFADALATVTPTLLLDAPAPRPTHATPVALPVVLDRQASEPVADGAVLMAGGLGRFSPVFISRACRRHRNRCAAHCLLFLYGESF